jgi:guanine nucleotide-binding protein subunit alpha
MHRPYNGPVLGGDEDPLALHPPVLETLEERRERLARDKQEKDISDRIDAEIERERLEESRGPKTNRILLLGASVEAMA